jgi:hypothetical protein
MIKDTPQLKEEGEQGRLAASGGPIVILSFLS